MHVLTRHALAAFVRWQGNDERGRRTMEEAGQVHPAEAAALAQLERNLRAHPPEAWFREAQVSRHGLVRADAPEAIMTGLSLRDDVTTALLAQVLPGLAMPRRILLEQALGKWLATHPERAVTKTGRQEEPSMAKTGIERLAEVCERYPGILKRKIPGWVRDRLMDEAMISTATTFMPYVSDLRGRAGIAPGDLKSWSDPPGWNGAQEAASVTASTPPAPTAVPGEPEAAGERRCSACGEPLVDGACEFPLCSSIPAAQPDAPDQGQVSPSLVQGPAPAPQEEAGGELVTSTEGAGPEALALAFLRSLPPAPWAQANGHAPLSEEERGMALAVTILQGARLPGDLRRRQLVLLRAAEILEVALD
jgi:hypothetical protein